MNGLRDECFQESGATVTVVKEIEAPLSHVWRIVRDFARLERWHPGIERCEGEGTGNDARRTLYFSNRIIEERLNVLDDARCLLSYTVTADSNADFAGLSCTIDLAAVDDARTRIRWTASLPAGHQNAAEVQKSLGAYYATRIDDLRHALISASQTTD
jgi:carbon monoxide dehydrogenase subunit G